MRYFILFFIISCLYGCSMFSTYPTAVVQGAEKSAEFAEINKTNVRAVNDEFKRVFTQFVKEYVRKELQEDALTELDELHTQIANKFYRPADINAELAQVLADYLKEPGIGLDKLKDILLMIAQKNDID